MNPIKLRLSGFLSYQDPVELDFSSFELACISGSNGAGKSSLLDAITWVLFGQARCREDDALINSHVNTAEVIFDFEYEGNLYRVQRSKPRGKSTLLEFYLQSPEGGWRALTEKSVRETENRLRQTLRLDYETFINASFFLQGKADQFAQQQPANRKKVLSSVLGLEVWEVYRGQAAEQRKELEANLKILDMQIAEIDSELGQEAVRKARLHDSELRLEQASILRDAKESSLTNSQRVSAMLNEQKRLADVWAGQVDETNRRLQRHGDQLNQLREERADWQGKLDQAVEVEQRYQRWQEARQELERWDATAASFHEIQARRAGPLAEITAAQTRLEEEQRSLQEAAAAASQNAARLAQYEQELPQVLSLIQIVQDKLDQRAGLEEDIRTLQQDVAGMDAENRQLRGEMNELKERIDALKEAEGAACPLCGQPLSPDDRAALITNLESDGRRKGDTFRQNVLLQKQGEDHLRELNVVLSGLGKVEEELRALNRKHDQIELEAGRLRKSMEEWQGQGAVRLTEVQRCLRVGEFAPDAKDRLAQIDDEARALGYDAAAHDSIRRVEQSGRSAEQALRELETARALLGPLERQAADLEKQIEDEKTQLDRQRAEYRQAEEKFQAGAAELPDLVQLEREVMSFKAEENRLRMEVGMVRQLVSVLDTQRERRTQFSNQRDDLTRQISRLKVLERAFSKDGVPALLIEQALPEIEAQANEILDRLSHGSMSVRFATQRQLKSKDEKKETLDILISDEAGQREYEMFSGGESFRVNFAIRMALSRVLAHRAGARLQMLFIDEGFGSQDAEGRQRLIEAINLVRGDFARVLVITHLEELKEAFPARIEIEKTIRGSHLQVIA